MSGLLALLLGFLISVITLYAVVRLFGDSSADLRTVALAAVIISAVGFGLDFIPVIGWIVALIVQITVLTKLMDCSVYVLKVPVFCHVEIGTTVA